MIRKRIPKKDDGRIYRMVVEELLPFTKHWYPNVEVDSKKIKERLSIGNTYVAVKGRRLPLGFVHVFEKDYDLFIDMLAVEKSEQGNGWGRRLMDRAERQGRRSDCNYIQLLVDEGNSKAEAFYKNRGYEKKQFVDSVRCWLMTKPAN